MKRSLKLWQKTGFVFTGILGVLLHFLYEFSGKSILTAPFSAVNESTWEHMKLLFFLMLIFSLIEYRFIGIHYENFWCAKLIGISAGILSVPFIYYTYTGALGVSADWFNIAIFFIAAALAYILETQILKRDLFFCPFPIAAFIVLCLIALAFIVFTFVQPKIPLFKDPLTNSYGI